MTNAERYQRAWLEAERGWLEAELLLARYREALEDIAQGGKGKALQQIAKDALDEKP